MKKQDPRGRRAQIREEIAWVREVIEQQPAAKDKLKAVQVIGALRQELERVDDFISAERARDPIQRLRLKGKIAGREGSFVAAQKFEAEAAKLQILADDLKARRQAEQLEDAPEEEQESMLLDSIPGWRRQFLATVLLAIAENLDIDLGAVGELVQREAEAA